MKPTLTALCRQFIENRDTIKSSFIWESAYLYPVCAAIFSDKRQTVDESQLVRCREILYDRTGLFSAFRGMPKLVILSMMAADPAPEEKLQKALGVYDSLKTHFFTSTYLPVASMVIADLVGPEQVETIAARTRRIYDRMKDEHPFLTSSEDSVFAALLALSQLSDEQVVQETERCYRLLKPTFFSGNAVQSLSHVLALGQGTPEEKCQKTLALYNGLEQEGYPYGTSYELATLGVLAMLPASHDEVVRDVLDAAEFLSEQKGYGFFGAGKKQRLMHAGMLVASDYLDSAVGQTMHAAAVGGTISLIVAQQAAMCAAVAASCAAASASANNS